VRVQGSRRGDQFPSWSPDGRTLLVTGGDGVSSVDLGTGRRTRLVHRGASDFGAAWSPDGRRIAFTHGLVGSQLSVYGDDPSSTLYLARADGTGVHGLIGHRLSPGTPAWSPDGGWLAFGAGDGIYRVRPDGSELRRLYKEDFLTNPPLLAWSPSGRRLAFIDNDGGLYLLAAAGGRPQRLLKLADAAFADAPSWSPDGTRIVFSATADGKTDGLYIVNVRTGRFHRLLRI
jgi:TolB protein